MTVTTYYQYNYNRHGSGTVFFVFVGAELTVCCSFSLEPSWAVFFRFRLPELGFHGSNENEQKTITKTIYLGSNENEKKTKKPFSKATKHNSICGVEVCISVISDNCKSPHPPHPTRRTAST